MLTAAADLEYLEQPHKLRKVIFAEGQTSAKRKGEAKRFNPVLSAKPEAPVRSEKGGVQGRLLGFSSTVSQFAAKQISYDDRRDEDPREALLKFADVTEKEPYWSGPAYAKCGARLRLPAFHARQDTARLAV